ERQPESRWTRFRVCGKHASGTFRKNEVRILSKAPDQLLGSPPEFAPQCAEFCRFNRLNRLAAVCIISVHRGATTMHTILRLPDVKRSTGLSRSTIYLRIAQGTFPKPVSLGGRAVGWLESEVQQWLQRRIEASRNESHGVRATLGVPRNF